MKSYNFQNPEIREKAISKARTSVRPKSYNSKSKRIQEAKKELIKQELLKEGFLQQVGAVLPQINKVLIKSALTQKGGAADRKLVYSILGMIEKDGKKEQQETIGEVLAELMKSS